MTHDTSLHKQVVRPQLSQLPHNALLPRGTYDPLLHSTQDYFWFHIEPHFAPVTYEDTKELNHVQLDPPPVPPVPQPLKKDTSSTRSNDDSILSRMRSFPLAHRLAAALLDEGPGQSNVTKNIRTGLPIEDTWIPSSPDDLRQFSDALEQRIQAELIQAGLLDVRETDELASAIRNEHWHLRNLNVTNSAMKGLILKEVMPELTTQVTRRDKKISEDRTEIKYIESMMEKGGKRGKGRFTKLLNQMHPNRNLLPGDPLAGTTKPGAGAVEEKPISKKRKKKHTPYERSGSKNQTDHKVVSGPDPADNLAPQIADIIWSHNNQAGIEQIVKECIERAPHLANDMKEARRKIANCMSFSRKPYRFRKFPDGVTYSATRI